MFVVGGGSVLACEAVGEGLPQWRGFDDGGLFLGVSDGGMVSDAREGPGLAVIAYEGGFLYSVSGLL